MRDLDARGQEERGGGRCVHGSLSVCRFVARLHVFFKLADATPGEHVKDIS